jgi:hypothetical protein
MNKSSPEYIRVREEIAKKYCGHNSKIGFILADRILEIKGISILCDDQTLPTKNYTKEPKIFNGEYATADEVNMLKSNFKKVVE